MKTRLVLPLLLLTLAACGQGGGSATESMDFGSTATGAHSPTLEATPSATPRLVTATPESVSAQSIPTTTPCQEEGRIDENEVPNAGFGRELPYLIYLPPCVPAQGKPLPSLYLLHGLARDHEQWLEIGVTEAADDMIRRGIIPPLVIVLPWERTGVELEPAVVDGLIPHVTAHYPVDDRRERRAIGGISRGGSWAFRIGLRHADRFSALGLHSPAIFAGDLFAVERWLEDDPAPPHPRVWIDIGDRDNLQGATEDLRDRLDELGVSFLYRPGEGRHELSYWQANAREYLRWYTRKW